MADDQRTSLLEGAQAWVATLPERPRMAAAYGSILGQSFDPTRSDVNLLLVMDAPDHDALPEAVQLARLHRLAVFLLTPQELARLPWLFPVKLHALRRHYRILEGEDLLARLQPDPACLRRACQMDLQNLALKIRRALLQGSPDPVPVREALQRFLPKLRDVLRVIFEEGGGPPRATMTEVLGRLASTHALDTTAWLWADQIRHSPGSTWPEAHEAAQRIQAAVEHLLRKLEA